MMLRRQWIATFAILALFMAGITAVIPAQSANAATFSVQQWNRVDIPLTSNVTYANPDTDVSITATFTAPDGSTTSLPGFWDGGSTWKVRFAPTKLGTWTYAVTSSDAANTGLNNITGTVQATAYTGNLDIYKHGFVQTSSNHRAFSYADGTPFFWLADTHWQAPNYERLDQCNDPFTPTCTNQFADSADRDISQGFSVYQTYPDAALNDGGGNTSLANWWTANYTHLNPQAFKDQFDVKMNYLADHGMVIALGMGVHWDNARIGTAAMTQFAKYVTARYASYPVVWITGQEVDVVPNGLNTLPTWKAVAQTIDASDGYNHPLSAHMDSVGDPKTFGQEPWHDWFATQGGHGTIRTQAHYKTYWDYSPTQPYLETEANYEELSGALPLSGTRESAWKALQSGSYGFSYGGAGTWAIKWDYGTPGWDDYQNGLPWFDGLQLPGRDQMTIMKNFYQSLGNWQNLTPRFGDAAFGTFVDPEKSVLSSEGSSTYVVYFGGGSTATGSLSGMDNTSAYQARWFNPRTGTFATISNTVSPASGQWTVPVRPDAQDWVLVASKTALPQAGVGPLVQSENLALKHEAAASSTNGSSLAEKAVDGRTNTGWLAGSATFPQTLQVDLGASYSLSSVTQQFHDNDGSTFFYRLEGSHNGRNWTTLVDRTGTGRTGQSFSENVSGSYQFVRIVVTNASNGHRASSDEFTVTGKDLAIAKTATASSSNGNGYSASQAIDGNPSTDWVAQGGSKPQWLQVDLGAPFSISTISQKFHNNDTFSYRIDGSLDGSSWTGLVDRTAHGVSGQTFIENTTGVYRFVKMTITGATNGNWASSDDFKVFGSEVIHGSENSAIGKTYSSSSTYSSAQTADKAFDGNTTTNWQSANGTFNGQWLAVDLGGSTTLSQATLSEYGNRTTGFRIEYWNGTGWSTAYTGTSIGTSSTVSFPPVTTTQARIFFTAGSLQPIIYEFELYGPENLALAKSYSSSSSYAPNQTADKAFDGNTTTNWQSSNGTFVNEWLAVNLGRSTTFSKATITEYGNRTTGFRIEYWNGTGWSTAYTGTTIGTLATVSFPSVTTTQARLVLTSGSLQPIIYEFDLYK